MRNLFSVVFFLLAINCCTGQQVESDSASTAGEKAGLNVDSIITLAESLIGVPYKYGGCTPDGFDCSGFVNFVYAQFGFHLPRSTSELVIVGKEIPLDSCQKGDIILFSGRNRDKHPVGHAGIVITDMGQPLNFIHSATSNARGVIVTAFDAYDYYSSRFVKVVRVID